MKYVEKVSEFNEGKYLLMNANSRYGTKVSLSSRSTRACKVYILRVGEVEREFRILNHALVAFGKMIDKRTVRLLIPVSYAWYKS